MKGDSGMMALGDPRRGEKLPEGYNPV